MDPAAAERQLNNIRGFILMEAKEKADEIRMKAKADADLERQTQVLSAKTKLADEYDRKEKNLAVELRIKASVEERRQRARLLAARDAHVQALGKDARARIASISASNATAYAALLKGLIKQGLLRLTGETKVDVRCRPQDAATVRSIAPAAASELVAELRAAGEIRDIAVTVVPDTALGGSAGGVVLSAMDGKIRCDNTLEERLTLAMTGLQPVVRDLLFPSARAEPREKPAINIHAGHHAPAPAAAGAGAGAGASASAAPAPKPVAAASVASPAPAMRPATSVTTPAAAATFGAHIDPFGGAAVPAPAPVAASAAKPAPVPAPAPAHAAADPFGFAAPAPAGGADPFAF